MITQLYLDLIMKYAFSNPCHQDYRCKRNIYFAEMESGNDEFTNRYISINFTPVLQSTSHRQSFSWNPVNNNVLKQAPERVCR